MSDLERYLFDTSFDSEKVREAKRRATAEAEAAAEPPPPTYGEQDLAATRESAFAEGKAAGLAEAEQAQSRRLAALVAELPQHFEQLHERIQAQEDERRRGALEAAITVVRKLFPQFARDGGLEEIRAVIDGCLERLRDEPRLVIRCADGDLDALKAATEASVRSSGFEGKLVFLADESIATGDVRVEWADGGAERHQADLWKEIDAIIARALTPAPADPADKATAAAEQEQEQDEASPPRDTSPSQPRTPAEIEPLRRAQSA